ncbi:MAG TPA: fatty acid desaturase [Kofleriaceae bacterium]|nr:fatty acid desaturase [Kofleriaceae bacterium]
MALPTILIPSAGVVVALTQVFTGEVGAMELGLMFGMYLLSMTGISVGWHRYLAHRSFQAKRSVRAVFAVLGSLGAQGPVINWVSNHRRHHAHSDEVGDPHSPSVTDDGRRLGGFRGFWHAHIGWMLGGDVTNAVVYSKDLLRDPLITKINRLYPLWVALSLLIPTILGGLIRGTPAGAFQGFIWGGLVQIAINQHATWTIASLAHIFGTRPYDTGEHDTSRNNLLVAIPILGDGWHNNHHAFPNVAIHGFEWWQLDPSGWVIRGLEKLGLAYDVRGVPSASKRQARRRDAGQYPELKQSTGS